MWHIPPAEEGECLTCHQPHQSEEASLLTEGIPDLCASCHDVEDDDFREAHLGAVGTSVDCRGCHDPHGSKEAGLFQELTHAPFAAGGCEACHPSNPQGGER
ncbi:MAG: cytochrome c3 family protein [Candidatus Eisenbacteria bacterium]